MTGGEPSGAIRSRVPTIPLCHGFLPGCGSHWPIQLWGRSASKEAQSVVNARSVALHWQEYEQLEAELVAQQVSPLLRRRLRRSPSMQEQQRRAARRHERRLAHLALQIHALNTPRVPLPRVPAPPAKRQQEVAQVSITALPPNALWASLKEAIRSSFRRIIAKAA
jgi:hypothetical protein